jgi:hypothetical protein
MVVRAGGYLPASTTWSYQSRSWQSRWRGSGMPTFAASSMVECNDGLFIAWLTQAPGWSRVP